MDFKELHRIKINDKADLVVSSCTDKGLMVGVNINKYITSEKYTGYTKGVLIPVDKLKEFTDELSKLTD